jgi:23S rRNA (uracil1939-C5)-methyltransferase
MIADCLRRIGGMPSAAPVAVAPSPRTWRYRARAEWRHDPAQATLGRLQTGTNLVVDLPDDPFVCPPLAECFTRLRDQLAAKRLPTWATELRAAAGDNGVSLAPPLESPEPRPVHATIAGERYEYDADCFFQANPFVLDDLVAEALCFVPHAGAAAPLSLAIDLYCGVGLFTIPLARRCERVIGVEGQPRAANFARRNAAAAGLRNVNIVDASVERWLEGAFRGHGRPPFVLLDPPRTGLPAHGLRILPRLRATRLTYVSCDPATLARDLKGLLASGYELNGVTAFDMFPQTHHVEIVAHLVRSAPNGGRRKASTGKRKDLNHQSS